MYLHQYYDRYSGHIKEEMLIADRVIRFLYATAREHPSALQRAAASKIASALMASWEFDRPLLRPLATIKNTAHRLGIDLTEALDPPEAMRSLRQLFERKIDFDRLRPMPLGRGHIVSPADGKALAFGSDNDALLPVKERFVAPAELLGGVDKSGYAFNAGVVVRLTPDAYHYVHAPVSGVVRAHQWLDGALHSCNPTALLSFDTPYVLNCRQVSIIDTDVLGGSCVGQVALINVAAMMIGRVEDAYSDCKYEAPQIITPHLFVRQGRPFTLFRPGSSTSIVLWDRDRVGMCPRLLRASARQDVRSRFSDWLMSPWVETLVRVRSHIATNKWSFQ